jgi:hypothetical protein
MANGRRDDEEPTAIDLSGDPFAELVEAVGGRDVAPQVVRDATRALSGPVAEVQLPADSAMKLRLIPEAGVRHVDDLRSDLSLLLNLACLAAGALLSWLASLFATGEVKTAMWALGAAYGALTLVLICLGIRAWRRATKRREEIFGELG